LCFTNMFRFLKKDPAASLEKQYREMLEKARDAQRAGDIKLYARLTDESEQILQKIRDLKA
jgi:hypothetical protein